MSLLYSSMLWALFLVTIPIVIHLFNFRVHKTVYFSNISFLTDIKNANENKSKLKNLLILLCRILTIVFLVMAFSRPYIPLGQTGSESNKSLVSIYLDNSFSMNVPGSFGNQFDASKERARNIIASYSNDQKFFIITNDFEARHNIACTKEQAIAFINQCQISPYSRKLSEIIGRSTKFIKDNTFESIQKPTIYLISDFQKNRFDLYELKNDSSVYYVQHMSANNFNNLYIDSCWFTSTGRHKNKMEELEISIINKGKEDYADIPIRLYINGKQKVIGNFNIEKNSRKELVLKYLNTETGRQSCYLEIDEYPMMFDNTLYFNYTIEESYSILLIQNKLPNKFIPALFKNDSSFNLQQIFLTGIKASYLINYQVVILDEPDDLPSGLVDDLMNFVSNGGVLVIIPGQKSLLQGLNRLTTEVNAPTFHNLINQETKVDKINLSHFIYRDVFNINNEELNLPGIKSFFDVKPDDKTVSNILLSSSSGKPLLIHNNFGKGKVYTFSFPLNDENTNFAIHPLFVPTIYNMALYHQSDQQLFFQIGRDKILDISLRNLPEKQNLRISDSAGSVDFIPSVTGIGEQGIRINTMDNIIRSGNYFIVTPDSVLKVVSFNYNRLESDPECLNSNEILESAKSFGIKNFQLLESEMDEFEIQLAEIQNKRIELWKISIILSLIFIICEILIIRLWKKGKGQNVKNFPEPEV